MSPYSAAATPPIAKKNPRKTACAGCSRISTKSDKRQDTTSAYSYQISNKITAYIGNVIPGDATRETLAGRILDALPQTQCTRCGYPDCAAYAQAIAQEQAAINQCPPGGTEGVARLAAITGKPNKNPRPKGRGIQNSPG